jgi:hypothetical protein
MDSLRFEWDSRKATSNLAKHGLSFEEAKTVFWDKYARLIHDPDHSESEDRFILMGMSYKMNIVIVCHSYREDDQVIRLISARKATKKEQTYYRR